MLVRRLVTGVRSSCEASATSWRCACTEASSALIECSSASSIALKLLARRPSSSSPEGLMRPLRSWVSATCSVACVRRLSGCTAAPATSRPSSAGERDAADDEQREDQAQAASRLSTSVSGWANCTARPLPSGSARTRRWMPSTSASRKNGLPPCAASARVRASTGSDTPCARALDDRALGVDHLLVAAHLVGAGRKAAEDVAGAAGGLSCSCCARCGAARRRAPPGGAAEQPFGGEPQARASPQRVAAGPLASSARSEPVARASAVAQLRVDLAVQLVGGEHVDEHARRARPRSRRRRRRRS